MKLKLEAFSATFFSGGLSCSNGIGKSNIGEGSKIARGDMPRKISDGRLALGLLAAFAVWLFAALPFLYGPPPRFAETSSPTQAHADQAAQYAAAKPDGSVNAPFFIRIPKTANEEAEEAAERREKSSTDRWLMIFTGAVALFTLFLFGATVLLYRAGEKQLSHLSDTAKRQLRAYVFLDKIDLRRFNIPKPQWNIQIAWKNTGGTRTRRLAAKVSHAVLDLSKQPLGTFDFHDEPNAQTFHGLIGPSQSVNPPPIPICEIHLMSASGDDMAFLIWGWAEYQDVFSATIRRTEFGFRVWIEGDISSNCIIRFESTEKHNAADEDCMKPPTSTAWSGAAPSGNSSP
jgi:hypothetical protein